MTESAHRKTAESRKPAESRTTRRAHCRWDLVGVSLLSGLLGMGLTQHYILATHFSGPHHRVQQQKKKVVVVGAGLGLRAQRRVRDQPEDQQPEGLPTALDPSGRSRLLATTTPKKRSAKRVVTSLGPWEKVPLTKRVTMPSEFCESSAARLDDLVFVVGGFLCDFNRVSDVLQVLNRTTGEWTYLTTLPPTAARTHQGAAAARSPTQPETIWLYLVSGQIGPGCTVGTTESWAVQIRKRKQIWSRLPDLPEVRYAPSAYVAEGFLHVVGGAGANRRDPRPEHWVLPLSVSGKAVEKAGWFAIDALPDGGADSAGFVIANDFAYRFGGQHGHPIAVNVLTDNNKQCQDSPEVAHVESFRRGLGGGGGEGRKREGGTAWTMAAPLPWPASHIGLSTVATDDERQALVISGKEGKNTTKRIAKYDFARDEWSELAPAVPIGQPDYLAWFDLPANEYLHVLKFRWHPTNSTLNDDAKSITKRTNNGGTKVVNWPNAFIHLKAKVHYGGEEEEEDDDVALRLGGEEKKTTKELLSSKKKKAEFVFSKTKRIREDFGLQIFGVDLPEVLASEEKASSFGSALRRALDRFGLVHFPNNFGKKKDDRGGRQISAKELVALHALLDHDKGKAPNSYHKGMCRLWREGIPQVNLLANKAARAYSAALKDDGEPCLTNTVYGMETYAWHADEASRPNDLAVRYTAFHAAMVVNNNSHGETHFASAVGAWDRLDPEVKRRAAQIDVQYLANPKSKDAFLPPLDVAGKRDSLLLADGVAKVASEEAADFVARLVDACRAHRTCDLHSSPLVVPHPRTGRPAVHLDVKQQVGFAGLLNFTDAQRFLVDLLRPVTDDGAIYHHRWRIGDVVVADNYHVLHTAAPGDAFNDNPRLIERVCVPGGYTPTRVDLW